MPNFCCGPSETVYSTLTRPSFSGTPSFSSSSFTVDVTFTWLKPFAR